jgi:hypothetical protein
MLQRKISLNETCENPAILHLEFLAGDIAGEFEPIFAQKFGNSRRKAPSTLRPMFTPRS